MILKFYYHSALLHTQVLTFVFAEDFPPFFAAVVVVVAVLEVSVE